MKTYNFEGKEYIAKDDVESLVRDRISKVSERARIADSHVHELETQLEQNNKKIGTVDALNDTVAQLQEQLNSANQRYTQHSTIASVGIIDPDIRDAVVWSYERTMQSRSKKDRVELGQWLADIKENPQSAPAVLQPHFVTQAPQATQATQATQAPQATQATQAPTSNAAVIETSAATNTKDILQRAANPDFYRANREAIKEAYYKTRNKGPLG